MNQTTTCVSSCHKQCMDSMFSRWYSSQNSHPCWKCIRHASGWKNSEQFSVSLNMGGGLVHPWPLASATRTPPWLLHLRIRCLCSVNPANFIRTSSRNTMRIQLRWHHRTRHGWEEKARECKHWSESYEECCAESHRNAATKSSYCTTTVLQGKPLHVKRYQTIPQDSPLPFKVPDRPVSQECHKTEIWFGCKIVRKALLTIVGFQLCDSAGRLRRIRWLYSELSALSAIHTHTHKKKQQC